MDAAEIARLLEMAENESPLCRPMFDASVVLSFIGRIGELDTLVASYEKAENQLIAERDALLDALDQARKERDYWKSYAEGANEGIASVMSRIKTAEAQRDAAQQSAKGARAQAYEECAKMAQTKADEMSAAAEFEAASGDEYDARGSMEQSGCTAQLAAAIRARIEAFLEPKP